MSQIAFVSGATGYIAQHLVKLLLANDYKVVGSVRSQEKGDHLKSLFGKNFEYEVISDLVKAGAFDESLKKHPNIEVFFHTASPVHFGDDNIQELIIDPAIEGTLNALKAVKAHGKNVKKFILTSSYVALLALQDGANHLVTEESWNPVTPEGALKNGFAGYNASKTFGEQAAWKFIEEEKPHFTFTSVLPPYVFGPQAFDSEAKDSLNLSAEFVTQFLKLTPKDPLPPLSGPFGDVRDVAKAHFIAGESEEADGKRLALNAGFYTAQTILNAIRKNFPQLQSSLPVGDPESEAQGIKSAGSSDFSKTNSVLKIDFIPIEKSVTDTIAQVLVHKK